MQKSKISIATIAHMLPSLEEYLHAKNLRYQMILSRDIVDQRILQSDWTRGIPGCTQPKRYSQILTSSDDYLHVKNLRCHLIPSRDIVNQIILQSDWRRDTKSHTQPKVVFSDAIFL